MGSFLVEKIENLNAEITHFWEEKEKNFIFSKGNYFWGLSQGEKFEFYVNLKYPKNILLSMRLIRRALRYDKSNACLLYTSPSPRD